MATSNKERVRRTAPLALGEREARMREAKANGAAAAQAKMSGLVSNSAKNIQAATEQARKNRERIERGGRASDNSTEKILKNEFRKFKNK